MSTDKVEREIVLKAPKAKVWKAISNASEFGAWFGVDFEGRSFVAGQPMLGKIAPTKVDPEVAKLQAPHAGKKFEIKVDRIEPEEHFSFFWHPFAIDPNVDYSQEEPTLVTFSLTEVSGGTKLVITETGFDRIPAARRAAAFQANDGGWAHQTKLIEKYVG